MNLLRSLVLIGGIAVIGAVGYVTFANQAGQHADVSAQRATPVAVDGALAAKAQEHCWYTVKSRSNFAKAVAGGPPRSATGAGAERLGDLILVTGSIEPAVGDDRFYGCALYEYTEGSPVIVSSKTWTSPPRTDAMIPPGFTTNGKRM